jgi:hypothetical protein
MNFHTSAGRALKDESTSPTHHDCFRDTRDPFTTLTNWRKWFFERQKNRFFGISLLTPEAKAPTQATNPPEEGSDMRSGKHVCPRPAHSAQSSLCQTPQLFRHALPRAHNLQLLFLRMEKKKINVSTAQMFSTGRRCCNK